MKIFHFRTLLTVISVSLALTANSFAGSRPADPSAEIDLYDILLFDTGGFFGSGVGSGISTEWQNCLYVGPNGGNERAG